MNPIITVVASVLVFGFLIFIHEFGHYITARIFKITIQEFSIGMGPRLVSWVSKKTNIRYSIALLPIGGYVAMPGENGEFNDEGENTENDYSNDPNTFGKKPIYQRFIVTAAGAAVNIVAGFLALTILASVINFGGTKVGRFSDTTGTDITVSSADSGLMLGDEIIKIGGKRVVIYDELSYEIMRRGYEPIDILVRRNGEEILLEDVVFPTASEGGQLIGRMDFVPYAMEKNFGSIMKYSIRKGALTVRMVWESLYDLITGRYTFAAVSGPVGISGAIGDAVSYGMDAALHIFALISINLGVMNLLPFPALDGGRLVTLLIEMITRKKLPAKVEGIINGVGLLILLAFSFIVMIKDVFQLIG